MARLPRGTKPPRRCHSARSEAAAAAAARAAAPAEMSARAPCGEMSARAPCGEMAVGARCGEMAAGASHRHRWRLPSGRAAVGSEGMSRWLECMPPCGEMAAGAPSGVSSLCGYRDCASRRSSRRYRDCASGRSSRRSGGSRGCELGRAGRSSRRSGGSRGCELGRAGAAAPAAHPWRAGQTRASLPSRTDVGTAATRTRGGAAACRLVAGCRGA